MEKFTEFSGEIIFQVLSKDIARKLCAWVAPGRTNMTLIIVTASATWLCRMDAHHESF